MLKKNDRNKMKEEEKKDLDKFYHNYGKFVSEFEHLIMSIRFCIVSLFRLKGLTEPEYLRVLLSDQTAFPLLTKLQTLISLQYKENPDRVKLLDKLFSHTKKIIERRNELIHGVLFQVSDNKGFLFKDKTNKEGLKPIDQDVDSEMFKTQTEKVNETQKLFDILNSYLNQDGEIFEHFFNKEKIESLTID